MNNKLIKYGVLNLCFLIILAGCSSSDPFNSTASNNTYFCDNARQMTISIGDGADNALIQFEGNTIALEASDESDDLSFTNNIYTLFYNDDDNLAVLEREGVPILTNCALE